MISSNRNGQIFALIRSRHLQKCGESRLLADISHSRREFLAQASVLGYGCVDAIDSEAQSPQSSDKNTNNRLMYAPFVWGSIDIR